MYISSRSKSHSVELPSEGIDKEYTECTEYIQSSLNKLRLTHPNVKIHRDTDTPNLKQTQTQT